MEKHEKLKATVKLMSELAEGELSAEKDGWLSIADVAAELNIRYE